MKYEKPDVVRLSRAIKVIQNESNKEVQEILDSQEEFSSLAAYAADE